MGIKKQQNLHKLGLALSGGGTRGIAHIGVFKALFEHHVPVYCVAGTSAGSIFGALYSAHISWEQMVAESKFVSRGDILNKPFLGSSSQNIEEVAKRLLGDVTFDQLPIPFAAVAVDIVTGEEVVLTEGTVATAVSASCAVPALFTPVRIDDKILVDGGLRNNMPADVCRSMGADVVLSVDLNSDRAGGSPNKLWDTIVATLNISSKNASLKGEMNSDVIICPQLAQYKNTSLDFIDQMVEEGYRAAKERMPEILQLLNSKF